MPLDGSLVKSHYQDFMKRLRWAVNGDRPKYLDEEKIIPNPDFKPIKYLMCGEYGEETKRPHYHALIFGHDVPDRKMWKMSNGIPVYSSAYLDDIWGHGFTAIGDVTWESAAYVARYVTKKINGALAEKIHEKTGLKPYERVGIDGEIHEVLPEYNSMSRGGREKGSTGIGHDFYQMYKDDMYPEDRCIVNGFPTRPPRYYDGLFEIDNPEEMEVIKERRQKEMAKHEKDNTRNRLRQKEAVKIAQYNQLPRGEI